MSLSLSEEQEELRLLVRRFLDDQAPPAEMRRLTTAAEDYDRDVWLRMADELGLPGLAIAEEYGGTGLGASELAIVLEEMGRSLYTGPFFASVVLAGQTLTHCDDEAARQRWLPGIASGSLTATLAVAEPGGRWDPQAASTVAGRAGDGWVLDGAKTYVVDGHSADLLLVTAGCPDGLGLFGVPGTAPGLTGTRLDTLDLTRHLARIEFERTPAVRIGEGDASALLGRVGDLVRTALAAEQVGGAAQCLDMAVGYAGTREQFGRPIGSFQAIKHTCAQLLVEVESARSASRFAASVAGEPGTEPMIAATVAHAYCSAAFTHAAKQNIQIHGGIGFTWEHDAHLYLRRAKSSELLFGSPRENRARLAGLLETTGPHR